MLSSSDRLRGLLGMAHLPDVGGCGDGGRRKENPRHPPGSPHGKGSDAAEDGDGHEIKLVRIIVERISDWWSDYDDDGFGGRRMSDEDGVKEVLGCFWRCCLSNGIGFGEVEGGERRLKGQQVGGNKENQSPILPTSSQKSILKTLPLLLIHNVLLPPPTSPSPLQQPTPILQFSQHVTTYLLSILSSTESMNSLDAEGRGVLGYVLGLSDVRMLSSFPPSDEKATTNSNKGTRGEIIGNDDYVGYFVERMIITVLKSTTIIPTVGMILAGYCKIMVENGFFETESGNGNGNGAESKQGNTKDRAVSSVFNSLKSRVIKIAKDRLTKTVPTTPGENSIDMEISKINAAVDAAVGCAVLRVL